LHKTCTGDDGPLIEAACFKAFDRRLEDPVGAILVTLLPPDGDAWHGYRWRQPPPPDAVPRRLGQPHLTWIFVARAVARNGLGGALLAAAAGGLLQLGYRKLLSTFLLGNESSTLWHWRNGFRLLPQYGDLSDLPLQ